MFPLDFLIIGGAVGVFGIMVTISFMLIRVLKRALETKWTDSKVTSPPCVRATCANVAPHKTPKGCCKGSRGKVGRVLGEEGR